MPSNAGKIEPRSRARPDHNGIGLDRDGIAPPDIAAIQRARMLAAMVDEVAERSAANVTVAHVVARSGVSRRTFYELFADGDDCFLAAFEETLARASRHVLAAYDQAGAWSERVRAGLVALLEFLDREPGAGRLLIVESFGFGNATLELRTQVLERIISVVDEGRAHCKRGKELPALAAEGVVGGALSVIHTRLLGCARGGEPIRVGDVRVKEHPSLSLSLVALAGPLMCMIVLPYLGQAAARQELERPVPKPTSSNTPRAGGDPLRDVDMRLTYRTIRVLLAVGAHPGASNRQVAGASGVHDQGQMSKLLARLEGLGLIANSGAGQRRGATNAWALTPKGLEVQRTIATPPFTPAGSPRLGGRAER